MVDLRIWRLFQHDAAGRPAFLEVRSSKAFIVSAMTLAVFTDIFLYGLVSIVSPKGKAKGKGRRLSFLGYPRVPVYTAGAGGYTP
jgi:hypothetical protein